MMFFASVFPEMFAQVYETNHRDLHRYCFWQFKHDVMSHQACGQQLAVYITWATKKKNATRVLELMATKLWLTQKALVAKKYELFTKYLLA